ncbi:MAG: DUF5615 family PIN-like protein [Proteobacteria bacterium]|nr:DUF5615 family PIN-like protein [Pseudomonadota bacterium]
MSRLLAGENFPLPVIEELRRLGHDVLTVQEAGRANQQFPDNEVLSLASAGERAVMTLNRKHFVRLHQVSIKHAGIIVCTVDLDYDGQAHRIHQAIKAYGTLEGLLIRVNRPD